MEIKSGNNENLNKKGSKTFSLFACCLPQEENLSLTLPYFLQT